MALLLVDLDNTLSDRAESLRRWVRVYLAERYGMVDDDLAAEMVRIDGDGLRDKASVAADMAQLLELTDAERAEFIVVLRRGTLAELRPTPGVIEALDAASAAGFRPVILTNGKQSQQEGKVAALGLAPHVHAMVVSETVGVAKPDPEIFRIAARVAGDTLEGAWMIGDAAESDIAGAVAAGLRSVWLRRGRAYPSDMVPPTRSADSFAEAVGIVIAHRED